MFATSRRAAKFLPITARSGRGHRRRGSGDCDYGWIWCKLESIDVLADLNEVGKMRNVEGVDLRILLPQLLEKDNAGPLPLHVGLFDEEREPLYPLAYWRLLVLAPSAMRVLERDVRPGRRRDVRGRRGPRVARRLRVSPEGTVLATEVPHRIRGPVYPDLDDRPELRQILDLHDAAGKA
jgi:hypothetical protein